MNEGKKFEQDFKKSVPSHAYYYRLKDGTGNIGGQNENLRFQATNICDCILYGMDKFYMLELKTHKGKSIPFSCVRDNQLQGLYDAGLKKVYAGFIINFRDIEKTFYINACSMLRFKESASRKSYPLSFFETYGQLIPQTKLRTRYRYDIDSMLMPW